MNDGTQAIFAVLFTLAVAGVCFLSVAFLNKFSRTPKSPETSPLASERTFWRARDLGIADEPLIVSLLKYRRREDRYVVGPFKYASQNSDPGNLVSSITHNGLQKPIIDLDIPHVRVDSTTEGHSHLYLDVDGNKKVRSKIAVVLLHAIWNRVFS